MLVGVAVGVLQPTDADAVAGMARQAMDRTIVAVVVLMAPLSFRAILVPVTALPVPAWSAVELRTLLDSQEGEPLQPLWRLFALTGLRCGEALGLRWGDVDWDAGRVTVRRNRVPLAGGVIAETSTKTNRVRVVDLDPETVAVLRDPQITAACRGVETPADLEAAEVDREAYIFTDEAGEPLGPNSVSYRFRAAVQKTAVRRIPLHVLRHTHIRLLVAKGCAIPMVAATAGHADPSITLKVYSHSLPGAQQDALRAMARGRTDAQ